MSVYDREAVHQVGGGASRMCCCSNIILRSKMNILSPASLYSISPETKLVHTPIDRMHKTSTAQASK